MLPYPRAVIDWEVVFIFLWALVEWARLYLGEWQEEQWEKQGAAIAFKVQIVEPSLSLTLGLLHSPSAASRGNKTELLSPLTMSLALAVPVAVFHIYYLQLQTYV